MWQCGNVALWQCDISGLHKKSPPELRRGLSPPLGEEGRGLVLTQIVHDAADLLWRKCALAARVAQLSEFVFERLAYADPVL